MSEVQETSTTDGQAIETALPPSVETTGAAEPAVNSYKSDPGYHPIDLSNLPEDVRKPIEDRINYFYRQVKDQNRTLGQFRTVAEQQSAQINDLMNATTQVVDHLQTRSFEDTEATLKATIRQARLSGDSDAEFDAQEKLIELKANKIASSRTQTIPKAENQSTQRLNSLSQISDNAARGGELSADEQSIAQAWLNEKDQNGSLLRPWAFTNDVNGDGAYQSVLTEAAAVWRNPRFANAPIVERLAEVDKRMGLTRTAAQSVMGGNLTNGKKSGTIQLSSEQQKIAIRMDLGAKKGAKPRTDAEKISAYIEQMKTVQKGKR